MEPRIFVRRDPPNACWIASFGFGIVTRNGVPMPCAELPLPFTLDASADTVIADLSNRFPCALVTLSMHHVAKRGSI
jgi:hypothetical protein